MCVSGGGEFGKGDILRAMEKGKNSPPHGALFSMCRHLGIEEDDRRTINNDDGWEYFYELFGKMVEAMPKEKIYDSLASFLSPQKIDKHLAYLDHDQRKTA
jgi:hypothetical protein